LRSSQFLPKAEELVHKPTAIPAGILLPATPLFDPQTTTISREQALHQRPHLQPRSQLCDPHLHPHFLASIPKKTQHVDSLEGLRMKEEH